MAKRVKNAMKTVTEVSMNKMANGCMDAYTNCLDFSTFYIKKILENWSLMEMPMQTILNRYHLVLALLQPQSLTRPVMPRLIFAICTAFSATNLSVMSRLCRTIS